MNRTTGASSTLDQYLREINKVPLLTVEEERRLARDFRDGGNKRSGHRLVEANLRFVVKVAFEYRSYGLRMADLIQEGNIGLMKAVQKFDPDKEIRLISYAVWWIRAYIQNHILKSWSLVKIGTTQAQRKLFFSLARTRHEIERVTPGAGLDSEGIDVQLVAKKLRVRPSDVVEMQQRMEGRDLSLDAPVADGTSTHLEFTPADGDPQDEELARVEEDALVCAPRPRRDEPSRPARATHRRGAHHGRRQGDAARPRPALRVLAGARPPARDPGAREAAPRATAARGRDRLAERPARGGDGGLQRGRAAPRGPRRRRPAGRRLVAFQRAGSPRTARTPAARA